MRLATLLLSSLAFLTPLHAENMKTEPADFRGIVWQSSIEPQRASLSLIREEGDVAYYRRKGESLTTYGQAEAIKIAYRYYKGQFSAGVVQTYGRSNREALTASLFSQLGEPLRPRKHIEMYVWEGKAVSAVLTCEVTTYCAVELFSMPLRELEVADTGNATTFERDRDGD